MTKLAPSPAFAAASFLLLSLLWGATHARAQIVSAGRMTSTTARDTTAKRALTNAPRIPVRRIAAPRRSDSAENSRVRFTSDSALDDYSAWRDGERFYVLVPHAEASFAPELFDGSLYANARVERQDEGLLISFRVPAGVAARVSQNFNRLDVIFTSQESQPQQKPNVVAPSPTPSANASPSGNASQSG
ncbi:MAG: hypothetical protein WCD76_10880, partial [Pyrinomonadaceae bacterium]